MKTTYRFPARLTPLALGIMAAVGTDVTSADIILTFSNSSTSQVTGTASLYSTCSIDFQAGREFRMCDPGGSLGGGFPIQKDSITGGETWTFDSTNNMSGTAGMPDTAGINPAYTAPYPGTSAAPAGGPALDQGANFFGAPFSFLAPIVGSNAASVYGTGAVSIDPVGNKITLSFPVLEAQWSGVWFPLGQASGAITFSGDITVTGTDGAGNTTFDYIISAEELIDAAEDPNNAGFSGWTAQWLYTGSGTAPETIFSTLPQSPIASTGVIGPTSGGPADGNLFNDGRITLAESEAAFGVDTGSDKPNGITNPCTGGCFDFTVTGITGSAEEIILPLTSPIPDNPVYRKFKGGVWGDFDTSTGDTIESGLSTVSPVDCTGVTFTPGLTTGHNCVRLSVLDGGVNDLDGAANTSIVDPGGVASAPPAAIDTTRPGQTIDDAQGCSLTTRPVSPLERADWWIVAGFLALIGLRRKITHRNQG